MIAGARLFNFDGFRFYSGSFWNYLSFFQLCWDHVSIMLASCWHHFIIICDNLGITLGTFWDHFEKSKIILESFWDRSGLIQGSFQKKKSGLFGSFWSHFPTVLTPGSLKSFIQMTGKVSMVKFLILSALGKWLHCTFAHQAVYSSRASQSGTDDEAADGHGEPTSDVVFFIQTFSLNC